MPLERMHSQSKNAAMAGRCAADQQKFKEMADLLFENQEEWSQEEGKEIFKSYASGIDLNQEKFNTCLEESQFKSEIEKSLETAVSFGVSGTPAIFIEGEFLNGAIKKEKLLETINKEIAKD
jgi:protein-disulfide isomerase